MNRDVAIVGGGVAGLSAAIYTARAGLDTLVIDGGEPILARNAHLENFPGFPGGVDARRFLSATREQATDAGAQFREGLVTDVRRAGSEFQVEIDGEVALTADRVIAASWADASYLDGLDVETEQRGSKRFVLTDQGGRTDEDGVYAAGRLADQLHQAVVCAGHGAQVGIAVVVDSEVDFYHDWVTPEGYFTGRGREVPPGCEEIDDEERLEREGAARERFFEHFDGPPEERPTMHPSVAEDED